MLVTMPETFREINSLGNKVRSEGWGFVPLTDAELDLMTRNLRQVIQFRHDPRCLLGRSLGRLHCQYSRCQLGITTHLGSVGLAENAPASISHSQSQTNSRHRFGSRSGVSQQRCGDVVDQTADRRSLPVPGTGIFLGSRRQLEVNPCD